MKARYGPFADELLKAYPAEATTVPKTARDLMRDAAFGWHTWAWARLQAKTGKSKVFYYYFDQHPEYPADSPRPDTASPHGADVPYVFQHLNPSNPQITRQDDGDFGGHVHLLDELRQARRSQRRRRPRVAGVQRRQSGR